MIDMNHLCPRCMGEWRDTAEPCPRCGFSWKQAQRDTRELPPFSILAGKYLMGVKIGAGGFGITYMAMDLTREQPVAVKEFFPAGLAGREGLRAVAAPGEEGRCLREALRSFRREAELLARMSDTAGIIPYRDFLEENGTSYLVTDYAAGMNVRQYMSWKGVPFPEAQALSLMGPVLEAVERMHERGILHRDISPENLILKPDGRLVLIDFGAAREYHPGEGENLTVILKRGYAPEEQYSADGNQGPWTDIYACCAVLYQMMSGILPQEAAARREKDMLTPLDRIPGLAVSGRTARVLERGMSLEPADRYGSVRALAAALFGREGAGWEERFQAGAPGGQFRSGMESGAVQGYPADGIRPGMQGSQPQPGMAMGRPQPEFRFPDGARPEYGQKAPGSKKRGRKKVLLSLLAVLVLAAVSTVSVFWFLREPETEVQDPFGLFASGNRQEDGSIWYQTGYVDYSGNMEAAEGDALWEENGEGSSRWEFSPDGITYTASYRYPDGDSGMATYQMDKNGRILSVESAEGERREFVYEGNTVTVRSWSEDGVLSTTAQSRYDEKNRLVWEYAEMYDGPDSVAGEEESNYTYEDSPDGSYRAEYTTESWFLETDVESGAESRVEESGTGSETYDEDGNLLTWTEEYTKKRDGEAVSASRTEHTYSYNEQGDFTRRESRGEDRRWDENGEVSESESRYTYTCEYEYDADGNMLFRLLENADQDGIFGRSYDRYTYDQYGNCLTVFHISETEEGEIGSASFSSYTYERFAEEDGSFRSTGESSGTLEPELPSVGGASSSDTPAEESGAAESAEQEEQEAWEPDAFGWPEGVIMAASDTELSQEEYEEIREYLLDYRLGNSSGVLLAASQGESALTELSAGACDAALVLVGKPFLEEMEFSQMDSQEIYEWNRGTDYFFTFPLENVGDYELALLCRGSGTAWQATRGLYEGGFYEVEGIWSGYVRGILHSVEAGEVIFREDDQWKWPILCPILDYCGEMEGSCVRLQNSEGAEVSY